MQKYYTSLGLMSGTSGDGVDASIINSNGIDQFEVIKDKYYEYDTTIYNGIHSLKKKIHSLSDINKYLKENYQTLSSYFDIAQIEYIDDRRYNLVLSNGRIIMLPKVIDSDLLNFIKNNIDLIDKNTNYKKFLDLRNFHNKTIRLK